MAFVAILPVATDRMASGSRPGHDRMPTTQQRASRPLVDDNLFLPVPLVGVVMGSQSDWDVM